MILLFLFSSFSNNVFAAVGVPTLLHHQGRLLNSAGDLLGGSSGTDYCFKFSLFTDEIVGGADTQIWPTLAPKNMTVNVKNGVLNVDIGDTSVPGEGDILDFDFNSTDEIYLNVEVAAQVASSCSGVTYENLGPRQRVVSAGYAINSKTVGGFVPSQTATNNQIPVINSSGTLNLTGAVNAGGLSLTLGSDLPGDIYYRDADGNFARLPIGSNGKGLVVSSEGLPSWQVLPGSGGGGGDALTGNSLSQFASTTSSDLAGVISDETGTGALVFSDSPTFTTPNIGNATGSISGNATTATNVAYTGLTGTIPTWNQSTTGNAATATNLTGLTATISNLNTLTGALGSNAFLNTAFAPIANPTFTGTVSGITAAMVGAPSGSGTSTGSNTGDQTLSGLGGQPLSTNLTTIGTLANTTGFLYNNGLGTFSYAAAGSGSVTSVAMTVPTGLSISGSPITTSGTLALTLTSGYVIPTTTQLASYLTSSSLTPYALLSGATFTGTVSGITAAMVGAPSGSGTSSGTNTGDNSANTSSQPVNTNLTSLSGLSFGSVSFVKMTAAGTFALDTTVLGSLATQSGTFSGTSSGTNTGDNATNSQYSGLVTNATHTGDATGATALTVVGINNTLLSGLATGILKNTTGTGVPSIAIVSDFPILNQSTTGNAATATNLTGLTATISNLNTLTGSLGSNAFLNTAFAPIANPTFTGTVSGITAAMVGAPSGSGTSSGTNTGNDAINSLYSGLASSKQDTLVSATNIKTINGITLLGPGDIGISGAGGDVTGPASAVSSNVVLFDGTTGKVIKDSGLTLSGSNTGDQDLSGLGGQPLSTNLTTIGTLANTTGFLYNNGLGTFSYAAAGSGSVTSVAMTVPTGLSISGSPITTSGTLALTLTSGYVIPTTTQLASYLTSSSLTPYALLSGATFTGTVSGITAAMVGAPSGSGTSTGSNTGDSAVNSLYSGLVTMTYPSAGIALSTGSAWGTSITDNSANWNTAYTNRITSLTTTGSGPATLLSNVLNIPTPPAATFTSLTTTGNSGPSSLTSGVLNVPNYTLSGLGGISLTSLSATSPIFYDSTTGIISSQAATTSVNGYLTSADWNTFNGKQSALTFSTGLTNTGGTITVNTSQNISTLSNLSTAGFVQTTSAGLLSSAALTSLQVTNALGFTPISGNQTITLSGVITGSGTTAITTSYASGIISTLNGLSNSSGVLTNNGSGGLSWAAAGGGGTVTSVAMTVPTGLSISGSPITTSGTLALTLTSGYVIPTTTQLASYLTSSSLTPYALLSGATFTGAISATNLSGTNTGDNSANTTYANDYRSTNFVAGTNYQAPITLTTTNTSGAATLISNTLNIPNYANTLYTAGTGLTLTGGAFSVNTSQNITQLSNLTTAGLVQTTATGVLSSALLTSGQVTTALGFTPISGNQTITLGGILSGSGTTSITAAAAAGYYMPSTTDQTNWGTAYTNRITSLTTTGSGPATLISNVLNIPTPPSAAFTSLTTTGNSGPSSLTSGVLNVPNYTLAGLGGIGLTSLSATSPIFYDNTTGVISSQAATTSVNGYLTSTDWNTFNNKQAALTFSTGLTNTGGTITVNTSQNISTLSNLSTAGLVQTTSGGVLSSAPLTIGQVTTALGFTPISGNQTITLTGDITGSGTTSIGTTLATVATAGTTGSSTAIPVITINAKGLTTSITTAAVIAPAGTLTGATLASGVTASSLTSVGTLSSLAVTGAVTWSGGGSANANSAYTFTNGFTTNYPDTVAIEALAGTSGFLKKTAANTWTLDTNTYLTSYTETDPVWAAAEPNYFNLGQSETVTGIPAFNGGVTGTSAPFTVDSTFLVTNLNADLLDGQNASAFLTGNQTITLGGILSGSGTTSITAAAASGYYMPSTTDQTNWGTAYTNRITSLTTTGSGPATLISNVLNIPTPPAAAFTSLTTTGNSGPSSLTSGVLNVPNYTLSGLGGQPLNTNLSSIGVLANTAGFLYNNGTGSFSYAPAGAGDMILSGIQTVTGDKTFNDGTLSMNNVLGTFASNFTNANTAAQTYTLQNASGTLAFITDITGTNSGTNTGDNAANTTYANDYRSTNFVAGTNYIAPYGSTPANYFLASPSGSAGVPTFRGMTVLDMPVMTATVGGAVPTPPNDINQFLNGAGTFTVPTGGTLQTAYDAGNTIITTDTRSVSITGITTASGATAVASLLTTSTLTNSTASGFQFGNRNLVTVNGGTAGTEVGQFIRMTDSTSLGNTVRGLEVQAYSGTNNAGINTGIATFGKTFGIQAETTAQAGSVVQAAAVFADLNNYNDGSLGNAIRAYSNDVTSANLVYLTQETSTFTGDGLLMNFAAGSGTFSGNFADFQNNSVSKFKITSAGNTFVNLAVSTNSFGLCHEINGAGVDQIKDCVGAPTADYAEKYPVERNIEYGDVVAVGTEMVNTYDTTQGGGGVDWENVMGKVTKLVKADKPYQQNVVGIVVNNYGDFTSAGNNIKDEDNPMPVALNGRVLVKISNNGEAIEPGDYITASDDPGKAIKATKSGTVIGKALEAWTPDSGVERIMIFVEQGYYNGPDSSLAGLTFGTSALFNGEVTFAGKVEFTLPPLFNNDTGGFAIIKQGDRRVEVNFESPYIAQPVVNATMSFETSDNISDADAQVLFDAGIQSIVMNKNQSGFTILINKNAPRDLRFSWTALAIKDAKIYESIFEGLTFTPSVAKESTAEEIAAQKLLDEKATADKVAADAVQAEADKIAAEKAAAGGSTSSPTAEEIAAQKLLDEKATADKASADAVQAEADKIATEKATSDAQAEADAKATQEKAGAEATAGGSTSSPKTL